MADIDSLSINISASTKSATTAIDQLIRRLGVLDSALGQMNTGHFDMSINNAASALWNLSSAVGGIDTQSLKSTASGISAIASASAKLSGADGSSTALQNIASGLSAVSAVAASLPDPTGIVSLANAIKQLGGTNATNAAFTLGPIAEALRQFQSVGPIPDVASLADLATVLRSMGTKTVTQAAASLPYIADALKQFSGIQMPDIAGISELASAIAKLGYASVQKAAANIPMIATAFKTLIAELQQVPSVSKQTIELANSLAQLAQGSKGVNTVLGTQMKAGFASFSAGANRARLSTISLTAAIAKLRAIFYALRRVFSFIKSGIEYYSDLIEVQNVVDVTFGKNASKMEALTRNSIKQLGMSELTAKQIGARYQAMGTAMGITQRQVADASEYLSDKVHKSYGGIYNDMSDVSIQLTKLAADMASFYNTEQADVAKDLESVFTGMTRPLRKYGRLNLAA